MRTLNSRNSKNNKMFKKNYEDNFKNKLETYKNNKLNKKNTNNKF
jgi:hypothetical protein